MTSLNLGVSDTLGNHSIIFSSDYAPSLPKKNNFLFSYIYQKPRASLGINLFSINYYQPFPDLESYQLIYKCGLNLPILYPFSKFQRMEGHFVFGEERKYTFLKQQQIEEKKYNLCIVEAAFVHDTSIFSNFGNTKGSKGRIFCNYAIPLSAHYFSAFTFGGDLRYYISLTPRNILANRIFLVKSKGRDKETFYLGGVSFLPQVWSSILRGTDWGALKGHSFINISGEWRFPFIDRLNLAFPVSFNNIRGVIFTDFAATEENKVYCYGYGLRLSLGVIPIRLDWAYLYESKKKVWDKSPKFHFSLGYDF
jgi:outer membrane protein assembly factor BamA